MVGINRKLRTQDFSEDILKKKQFVFWSKYDQGCVPEITNTAVCLEVFWTFLRALVRFLWYWDEMLLF